MNNAGRLLRRRHQHATACFIQAGVRRTLISPSPPLVICEPHAGLKVIGAGSVSLLALLDPRASAGFNGSGELEVNICVSFRTSCHLMLKVNALDSVFHLSFCFLGLVFNLDSSVKLQKRH